MIGTKKLALLAGVSLITLGAFSSPVKAAAIELAGTAGAATAISGGDSIVNATASADHYGFINTHGAVAILASTIANDGVLYISDGTGDDNQAATFASLTLNEGVTLGVVMGAGINGAGVAEAQMIVTGATNGGGTLSVASMANSVTGTGSTLTLTGATTLAALNVTGGAGGVAAAGSTMTLSDVTAASAITTVTLKGGAGGASAGGAAGNAGGALTITNYGSAGAWTGTSFTVGGGAGGAGQDNGAFAAGAGGAIANNAIVTGALNGAVNITGGNAGAAGNGGAAAAGGAAGAGGAVGTAGNGITLSGLVTGNLTFASGAASAGGTAGAGGAGGAGAAGGAVYIKDVAAGVTGNVIVTSGAGSAGGTGLAGVAAGGVGAAGGLVTVTDIDHITGNLTVTAGAGGAGAAAATTVTGANGGAGGAITLANPASGAQIGGNISVTAGAGAAAGASSTTNAGGVGAAGGAVTITDVTSAVVGTTTLTAGSGAAGAAGGGGGTTGAAGGAGGAVNAKITGATTGNISLVGGTGANGGAGTASIGGAGGAGGAVNLELVGNVAGSITLNDGAAGTAGAAGVGAGGAAGAAGLATLTLTGTTQVVTGAVIAAANNEGALVVTAGGGALTTFSSTVGSSTAYLKSIDSSNGVAVRFADNVYATTITSSGGNSVYDFNGNLTLGTGGLTVGSGDATFAKNVTGVNSTTTVMTLAAGKDATFDGTTAQTVTGKINGGGAITSSNTSTGGVTFSHAVGADVAVGAITNGAKPMIFGSTLAAASLNTGAGAVTLGGTSSLSGALASTGTLNLGANTFTVGGNVTGTSNTITTTIGNTYATTGHIVNTANAANPTFTTALTITPTMNGTAIATGDKIVLIQGTAANGAVALPTTTVTGTGLVSWTASTALAAVAAGDRFGGNIAIDDVLITATVKNANTLASLNTVGENAINAAANYDGADANALNLAARLQNLAATADFQTPGSQLAPEANGVNSQVAFDTFNGVIGTIASRNDEVRMAQIAKSGMSSGEALRGAAVWAQGFGSIVDQGKREGIDGYDATTAGGSFGADMRVFSNLRAGASFAYANTDVDDQGTRSGSGLEVNSYMGSLYASYAGAPWYVDASVTLGAHDYDSTRYLALTNQTAKGSHDGWQYGLRSEVGYPLQVSKLVATPYASLAYNYLDQEGYTETGAPGANLTVKSADTDSIRSGLGVKAAGTFGKSGGWTFKPNAHATWMHEFNDKAPSFSSTFAAAGGGTFTTPGMKLATEAGILGVGVDIVTGNNLTLSAKYDLELRDQFTGHNGLLQARYEF